MKRAAAIALVLAAWPAVARGNPVDAFGFGARAASLGQAQTAAARDTGAIYYNPALLLRGDDVRIDVGYQAALPTLELDGRDVGVDSSRGLAIGLAAPGRFRDLELAIGAALFLPDQQLTRTRAHAPGKPHFVLYDNRPQRLFLGAGAAVAIGDRLSIGAGVAYMARTEGGVTLDGRIGYPDAEDSDLAVAIDVDLQQIRYLHAGAAWRATDWLDVGLSYRAGFSVTLDQTVIIQGDVGAEGQTPIVEDGFVRLRALSMDHFQPAQVAAGLAARLTPDVLLAFDLVLQRWSSYRDPASVIEAELDVGDFNDLVDVPDRMPAPPAHFSDVAVPSVGVEWRAAADRERALDLRAGYRYEASPTPDQLGATNFVDNDKHTAALGAGLTVASLGGVLVRPLSLDLAAALTVLRDRDHHKLSPVDVVGDYQSGGHVWQLFASSRWSF